MKEVWKKAALRSCQHWHGFTPLEVWTRIDPYKLAPKAELPPGNGLESLAGRVLPAPLADLSFVQNGKCELNRKTIRDRTRLKENMCTNFKQEDKASVKLINV